MMSDAGWRPRPAYQDKPRLVRKKKNAKIAVVRVSTFAVPRPVMKPLVELTRPPPSDYSSKMTAIIARTRIR